MISLRSSGWAWLGATALILAGCSDDASQGPQAVVVESDNTNSNPRPNVPGNSGEQSLDVGDPNLDPGVPPPSVPSIGAAQDPSEAAPRPVATSGDDFVAVGTNPFVMVGHDPLSTFATDVDTASYDVFRRDVNAGTLPVPESVRLEEYVNYFRYDYPAPPFDAEVPFDVHLAAAPNLLDTSTTLLRVGIAGKLAPPEQDRPANLVFLMDVSGSMAPADRLPLARQVIRQTLDLLEPTDHVSIVTYASGAGVRLTPTEVSDRDTIVTAIDSLVSGGSTAGASGINLAYEQAAAGFIEGGINHVILCTDGDFNVGVSSTAELIELIKQKRTTGVTFTALGFGRGNLNDAMLESISNAGNGFYGVISDEAQAGRYVSERMLSTLSLIARDVKVQVEFNPNRVSAYRLLGYENRSIADEDFRDDVVDAGEIGAGHQVTALYELVLAGAELPAVEGAPAATGGDAYAGALEVLPEDLVLVKVRYKQLDATAEDQAFEVSRGLAPAAILPSLEQADADLAWAISVAAFSEILKDSPYARPEALEAIGAVFEAQAARDADRTEFGALFSAARGMMAPSP